MPEQLNTKPSTTPHWIKAELQRRRVSYAWLAMRTGSSYPVLLNALNGKNVMPSDLEERIRRVIADVYRDPLPATEPEAAA